MKSKLGPITLNIKDKLGLNIDMKIFRGNIILKRLRKYSVRFERKEREENLETEF